MKKGIRDRMLVDAKHQCSKCHANTPHIHHIVAVEKGGTDDEDNLIVLCPTCHDNVHMDHITPDQLRLYKKNWLAKCKMNGDKQDPQHPGDTRKADVLYWLFWDSEKYQLQWPPQGGPSTFNLLIPVGVIASPIFLNKTCGMTVPGSSTIYLWHYESKSILPKDKTLRDAGVKSGHTVVFVYETLGVENEMFCQIVEEGRKQTMRKQSE